MICSLLVAVGIAIQGSPLESYGPFSAPSPESLLGYRLGSRLTTYREQERVVQAIAGASPSRMKLIEFGKSTEGRPLRIAVISSPENMRRIEDIRKGHEQMANGDTSVAAKTVPIVWINETIHGNETASFESGMTLIHTLASSSNPSITDMLKKVVVIVNPVYNPDGHERYAVYYNSIARGSSSPQAYEMAEPSVIQGRTNHYRFDMNRDRVSFSQAETRQEVAEFYRWNPQVYVDQHGQVENYFFPPNPMSVNANVDRARLNRWTDIIGKETAKAFDERGYAYYVKDIFDLYYPGYLDSHTSLAGAIGMTHETDGGKTLAKEAADGFVVTLRRGIEKHYTAALAVIRASANNAPALLDSYAQFKKRAVSGEFAGKFQRVVIPASEGKQLERIRQQLAFAGVKSEFAPGPWSQSDVHDYWGEKDGTVRFARGSLVVDMAQPNGPVAKALLEPMSDFEPEFLKAQREKLKTAPEGEEDPGPEGYEFYDWTGWALPFAHNVQAFWCESAPQIPANFVASHEERTQPVLRIIQWSPEKASKVGAVIPYYDQDSVLAAHDLLAAGLRVMVNPQPMPIPGAPVVQGPATLTYPPGSFFILAERNEPGFAQIIDRVAKARGVTAEPLETMFPTEGRLAPGSESMISLRKPKIGIVFGRTGELAGVGAMWYLMEQVFKLPFTALSTNALGGDLSQYSAIVVPAFAGATISPKLREWVSAGGSLIVLDQPNWVLGSNGFVDLKRSDSEAESLPGSLFRAEMDARSFLSFGYPRDGEGKVRLAVPIQGSTFYRPRKEGGSVVRLAAKSDQVKLLTGWTFEDTEASIADTVWLQEASVGEGKAVIFMQDPTERAMWPGLYKALLNAMVIGPR